MNAQSVEVIDTARRLNNHRLRSRAYVHIDEEDIEDTHQIGVIRPEMSAVERKTDHWLWVEAWACLAWPALATVFNLFFLLHYTVTTAQHGPWVPVSEFVAVAVYTIGGSFGFASVYSVLRQTTFRTNHSVLICKIGLCLGIAGTALFPEGLTLEIRFEVVSIGREIFLALVPCLCFAHFLYLVGQRSGQPISGNLDRH